MRLLNIFIFLTVVCIGVGFIPPKKKILFNGKDFSGWDMYLGPLYDSLKNEFTGDALGLNRDPNKVFTAVKEDGTPAIRISGENFGGISTREEFANYHLRLEFKWGKKKWNPKRNARRDSGLLYHAVGPHGADGGFWMRSQEFQIQEHDCGDYWGCGGAVADVPSVKQARGQFVYAPGGSMFTFRDHGPNGRNCVKQLDAEKPSGEWNVLELYCFGDTSVHVVNGQTVMVLFNSRQPDGSHDKPLTKGKIQIQSEGAEIFFRHLEVEKLSSLPAHLLK